jgi:hypothetical protein
MAKKKDKKIVEYILKIGYNPEDEEIEYIQESICDDDMLFIGGHDLAEDFPEKYLDLIDGITIGET